ncbi:putative thioredoxin [Spiribacter salinus M19-40]|jgi:peroxiredoxin|uniref:Putative thioredoxin n=1 Tax=Spiribacter salinus M19-40 TaxID=1260251 RepID=R4VQ96_9GAMM|nr:TlpA disulfide reductase family protein [Spiribacter salinus]AGM41633.1 putative thioredoxin [Spiribacter salinus M19-40]
MRKEWLIGLATLLVLGAVSFVWLSPRGGIPAPELTFNMLDGEAVSLSAYRGEPVLIQFWATDCPTCISEMPELVALYQSLEPAGLNLVGVAMDYDPEERVRNLVARRSLPYPVALDDGARIANAFENVRVTPTTILIDGEGRVVWQRIGLLDFERLHGEIEDLLPEEQSA